MSGWGDGSGDGSGPKTLSEEGSKDKKGRESGGGKGLKYLKKRK